ncbi:MAG: LemA family protein [Bdellovibrionales bacterium]|nr:LemA family protein [Bdellovibrionales bacterium]
MTSVLIILGVAAAIVFWAVGIYNGLVLKKVATENAWSQIDVQLKRRYDLIPNLVQTVKGYAKHEQETLEKVIQARNSAMNAAAKGDVRGVSEAEGMLTGMLRQVFALSEAYPDLKANESFLKLQEELTSTENKVGFSRQHYNDSVATYNTAIQQVPGNIIAGFVGYTAKEFFELDASEAAAAKQAPQVSF